jgi:hypothetical protein
MVFQKLIERVILYRLVYFFILTQISWLGNAKYCRVAGLSYYLYQHLKHVRRSYEEKTISLELLSLTVYMHGIMLEKWGICVEKKNDYPLLNLNYMKKYV